MECKKKTLNTSSFSSSLTTTTLSSSTSSTSISIPSNNPSFSHQTPTLLSTPNNNNNMEHACKKKNHINHVPPPSPLLCDDKSTLTNKDNSAPRLVTDLTLSSHQHQPHNNTASKVEPFSNNNPIQNMVACSSDDSLVSCLDHQRKRFLVFDGDNRNKRMMKNRESAARSRARKQAYTIELQQKVQQLLEENARLKIQHQQLCEIEAIQQKRKHNLYRTSTAPF